MISTTITQEQADIKAGMIRQSYGDAMPADEAEAWKNLGIHSTTAGAILQTHAHAQNEKADT